MIINCFGLHSASGIPFLVQANGVTNLISRDLKSPFQLHITPKRTRCPHQVNLETVAETPDWLSDPLASSFLPVPRSPGEKIKVVLDPDLRHEALITQLSRLSSPTGSFTWPIWARTPSEMRGMYAVTNIAPVVLIGAEMRHVGLIHEHASYASSYNRNVVVFARERLPIFGEATWVRSGLLAEDLDAQPLEAIGAGVLRRMMDDA